MKELEEVVSNMLLAVKPTITAALAAYLSARAVQWLGSEPTEDQVEEMADEAVAELDLSGFDAIVPAARSALADVGLAAADHSGAQIKVLVGDTEGKLFEQVHEGALAYAKDRAAELVGKKWDGNVLVDNPDAEITITDTTRNKIKQLVVKALSPSEGEEVFDLKSALEDLTDDVTSSPLFSRTRAALIAQAEIGMAQGQGTLSSLFALEKITGLKVNKKWSTSHDERVCLELCAVNAAVGAIPLSHVFPSGDFAPLAHPRCRCSLVGVVQKKSVKTQKEDA